MEINKLVGINLKKIRQKKRLTLDELAKFSGVSKGMISQIEKGNTNPTINTIWKISGGLGVPYSYLLENKIEEKNKVTSKKDTIFQQSDDGAYRLFNYYRDNSERNFELFQLELDAGGNHLSVGHSKHSSEYIMVIKGILTLKLDFEIINISKNETINFDATKEHWYINNTKEPVVAVVINYYP